MFHFIERLFRKPKKRKPAKARRQFVTFKQLTQIHPGFSFNTLRHHRAHNTRGFNACVRKAGKRVYVDLAKFEAWVDGK